MDLKINEHPIWSIHMISVPYLFIHLKLIIWQLSPLKTNKRIHSVLHTFLTLSPQKGHNKSKFFAVLIHKLSADKHYGELLMAACSRIFPIKYSEAFYFIWIFKTQPNLSYILKLKKVKNPELLTDCQIK